MPKQTKASLTPSQQQKSVSQDSNICATSRDATTDNLNVTDNILLLVDKITSSFTLSFNACVDRIIDALDKKTSLRLDLQANETFDLQKK